MLVLTRRLGEEIVIGGNVFVRVVGIEGGKVRIGIAAPESVVIDRSEVHARRLAFHEEAHAEVEPLPRS
jgi:carbon storage regulator